MVDDSPFHCLTTKGHRRRDFLVASTRTVAAALIGSAEQPGLASAAEGSLPADVGHKFYADGRVMPFAGNTIVCHLPQQGEDADPFDALLDIYRELPQHRFARKLTTTPPSSYHMTIFGGANDRDRRLPLWPTDLPLDMSMEACNRALGERLREFKLQDSAPPYRMRVDLSELHDVERPLNIRLQPIDDNERMRLTRLRDRLATLLGIRAVSHDSYRFHITLAYLIQWLSAAEQSEFRAVHKQWREMLAKRCPVITLGPPEYCILQDMFAFQRQFYLS